MSPAGYPPIGEHAFLSDCHTGALIAPDGSVDWLPVPRFDSASAFARILDRERGGGWSLRVEGAGEARRRYHGDSLVLESRWEHDGGVLVAHDFLAVKPPSVAGIEQIVPVGVLVRLIRCERGSVRFRTELDARPGYGREQARWDDGGEVLLSPDAGLWLSGEPRPALGGGGCPAAELELHAGDAAAFGLGCGGGPGRRIDRGSAERLLEETVDAWRAWAGRSSYGGVGAAAVAHSAVVLRGLIFNETGALLAAPTTSLPEWIGGERNWDYRFHWHRDAALVVLSLLRLGHETEAEGYVRFLLEHCAQCDDRLEPMLAIDGGTEMQEWRIEGLEGYRESAPVRAGNEAREQVQLDSYGHVLDAAFSFQLTVGGLDAADLEELWRIVEMTCERWREPDHGKWEVRSERRHWTNSKLYAWVCLDRGARLRELAGLAPREHWLEQRNELRAELLERGYDDDRGSFVQSYDSPNLDASVLRIPMVGFIDGDDPRMLSTLERLDAELGTDGYLLHRYDPEATDDGLGTPEGAFLLSSFDMVSALVLAGRSEQAHERFERLCDLAGPLGLFSEEAARGELLGNYPQAFTHLALIDAAMNLDQSGRRDALHEWAERGGGC